MLLRNIAICDNIFSNSYVEREKNVATIKFVPGLIFTKMSIFHKYVYPFFHKYFIYFSKC